MSICYCIAGLLVRHWLKCFLPSHTMCWLSWLHMQFGPQQLRPPEPRNCSASRASGSNVVGCGPDNNLWVCKEGSVRVFNTEGEFLFDAAKDQLKSSKAMAFDRNGELYITDNTANCIVVCRISDGSFVRRISGLSCSLHGVTTDGNGNLFVTDSSNDQILVIANGEVVRSWSRDGKKDGQLTLPLGICYAGGEVAVADYGNNRVQVVLFTDEV